MHACAAANGYVPRKTHDRDAAVLVRRHLPGFLARVEEAGSTLPEFVKKELREFAGCGDFERGFVQVVCVQCDNELRVPFSCKGRGFCPSCMGRRMAEGAALWVDHLLPAVGYRPWVLSFEGPLAVRLGYDQALLAKVAERFARAVMQDLRCSVKAHHDLCSVKSLHAGVLTVVQRFRSDLGLYVHVHGLVMEGALEEAGAEVHFLPAQTPTPERLMAILARVHKALAAVDEEDGLDPALAVCVQLGLTNLHAVPPSKPGTPRPLTVTAFGMNLHAATLVDGHERTQLERVCRYLLRPPFAHDAVKELPNGRVRILFKAPWRNGVAHADLMPDTFLARLSALVPPPGFHQIRFYGVFANRHHLRARILPVAPVPTPEQQLALHFADAGRDW